jgi:hypothetical protein
MDSSDPALPIVLGGALFLLGIILGWMMARGQRYKEPDRTAAHVVNAAFDFGKLMEKAQHIARVASEIAEDARTAQKSTGVSVLGVGKGIRDKAARGPTTSERHEG